MSVMDDLKEEMKSLKIAVIIGCILMMVAVYAIIFYIAGFNVNSTSIAFQMSSIIVIFGVGYYILVYTTKHKRAARRGECLDTVFYRWTGFHYKQYGFVERETLVKIFIDALENRDVDDNMGDESLQEWVLIIYELAKAKAGVDTEELQFDKDMIKYLKVLQG